MTRRRTRSRLLPAACGARWASRPPRAGHAAWHWLRASWRHGGAIAALLVACACSDPHDPIVLEGGTIVIENRTSSAWRNVRVTVNDHFVGGAPVLAAGSRMHAPLSQFQTGFGRKFDRARMSVHKIEVTATDADGNPVALTWEAPKKQGASLCAPCDPPVHLPIEVSI